MADEDDDLYEDDELEGDESEEGDTPEPVAEVEKPKAKAKKEKPAPAAAPDPSQQQLAELGLAALKASFVEAAKNAGHVAADFDGIGLKGIDEAAKSAFIAEAEASHKSKIDALAGMGFVFDPEAAGVAGEEARLAAEEAAAKAAWGKPGPGQTATGSEKFEEQVMDEVKRGDTTSVIRTLLEKGGLADFVARGRKA